MKKKPQKAPEPDLFSMLAGGPPKPPPPPEPHLHISAFRPPPEPTRRSRTIQELELPDDQGEIRQYRIEKHEDEGGEFWKMFVRDANNWRRLSLLDGDYRYIPKLALYHAEQMLDWAAGYTDRTRDLTAKLRPLPIEEDVAF